MPRGTLPPDADVNALSDFGTPTEGPSNRDHHASHKRQGDGDDRQSKCQDDRQECQSDEDDDDYQPQEQVTEPGTTAKLAFNLEHYFSSFGG